MTDPETRRQIESLDRLAYWLDERFRIPGTNIRFGLDSMIGLIPGIGDTATAAGSAYLLMRAAELGVPRAALARMAWNILIDLVIGAIPLVGDVFDVGFKANRRNVTIIRRHLERQAQRRSRPSRRGPASFPDGSR